MSRSLCAPEDAPALAPGSPETHGEHPWVPAGASLCAGDAEGAELERCAELLAT